MTSFLARGSRLLARVRRADQKSRTSISTFAGDATKTDNATVPLASGGTGSP